VAVIKVMLARNESLKPCGLLLGATIPKSHS
jgi:hypothetical protein